MQPFLDLQIEPTYGKYAVMLRWRMAKGFTVGKFLVRRSQDGTNGWKVIGEAQDHFFVDPSAIPKQGEYYYQIVLIKGDQRYDSSVISTFGQVSRREFGAAYKIMTLEFMQLRQHTAVKIFKQRIWEGPCTKCVDLDTGQEISTTLCENCYGTGFEGGFYEPFDSYMKLMSIGPQVIEGTLESAGSRAPLKCVARMLAFPPLMKNDLIVDPRSDKRYLVETVSIAYVNGKLPFVFDQVALNFLQTNDVRYKVGLP